MYKLLLISAGLILSLVAVAGAQHPGSQPPADHGSAAVVEQPGPGAIAAGQYLSLATPETRLAGVVEFLAGEDCAGRRTGTPGADTAAEFIEAVLDGLGAQPVPEARGLKHGFSVTRGIQVAGTPRLAINGRELGLEKYTVAGFSGSGELTGAPLVFAGYAIAAPELEWNDFAGIEIDGAVVVALRGEPRENDPDSVFSGTQPSVYADIRRKATTARDLGAAALILVNNPLTAAGDELPGLRPTYSAVNFDIPVVFMKRDALVNALIGTTGLSWHELVETMDLENTCMSALIDGVALDIRIEVEKELATGYNVAGVIPGHDPQLAGEYVVIGAHYDHLGIGGPESTTPERYGEIHRGADDNASGVAAVLEVAHWASTHPDRLDRSLLVCLFSGEEMGLLGSAALMRNPPVPVEMMHSMVNIDMVGHLRKDTVIIGGVESALEFPRLLESPAAAAGVRLSSDRSGLGGSDQMSFLREGVPSLFLCTGAFQGYHSPDDTPDGINYEGIGRVAALAGGTVAALVVMPGRLTFNPEASAVPSQGVKRGKLKVSMGTVPSFEGGLAVPGMGVSDVVAGGPAELAGIQGGDIIIKIMDRRIADIHDFMFALQDCQPNQVVAVTVHRVGEELVFDVTLVARNIEH